MLARISNSGVLTGLQQGFTEVQTAAVARGHEQPSLPEVGRLPTGMAYIKPDHTYQMMGRTLEEALIYLSYVANCILESDTVREYCKRLREYRLQHLAQVIRNCPNQESDILYKVRQDEVVYHPLYGFVVRAFTNVTCYDTVAKAQTALAALVSSGREVPHDERYEQAMSKLRRLLSG